MIPLSFVLSAIALHWFADFVLQSNWMAHNKSKNNFPLFVHVLIYSMFMLILGWAFLPTMEEALAFAILNGVAHFVTDFFTSRVSSRLYAQKKLGSDTLPNLGFFTCIGFDQMLHYVVIFSSYVLIMNS